MPSLCIVPWCKAKRVKGIKFYKFPRQVEHRDEWLLALDLNPKDVLNYKDPRVCPKHFAACVFTDSGRRRLLTSATPVGNLTNGHNIQTRTQNLIGIVEPLQIKTDEPLEVANFVHSSYDLYATKSNSCSTSQALVSSFTSKEEEILDSLRIKNDEPMEVSNLSYSFYGLDTPESNSCNSFQALAGSFTLKEEVRLPKSSVTEKMKAPQESAEDSKLQNKKTRVGEALMALKAAEDNLMALRAAEEAAARMVQIMKDHYQKALIELNMAEKEEKETTLSGRR